MRPHRRQPTRLLCSWDSPGKNTGVGCHFLLQCMKVKSDSEVAQSCPTLNDPTDCSLPGSSVHGIFQARVLEWGTIAFSLALLGYLKPICQSKWPGGAGRVTHPGTVLCLALASATAWSAAEFALQRSSDPSCGQKRVLLSPETYRQWKLKLHLAVDFLTPPSFSVVSRGSK